MADRTCPIDGTPIPNAGKRVYCSRRCQQTAYRRRRGINAPVASLRRRALLEAQRLATSLEADALRALGYDVDLIVAGLR